MKIKCDYCGNMYEDTLNKCPSCGAANPKHKDDVKRPKTIEELQSWYKARNLPPEEKTRFFIGMDYKGARAFGIFKNENGEFVVYKNKSDGSRAVRYQGKDEEYAVNELYQKLKDEIVHQKNLNGQTGKPSKNKAEIRSDERKANRALKKSNNEWTALDSIGYYLGELGDFFLELLGLIGIGLGKLLKWGLITLAIIVAVCGIAAFMDRHNGYYKYNDVTYYNYEDTWYYYDNDWYPVTTSDPAPATISQNYDDYYLSSSWNSDISTTDWDTTSYYEEAHKPSESENNWDSDSDYDWDSDSDWDSGGTDWDSDW